MSRKTESAGREVSPPATEDQVIAFIKTHPDFLTRHCDLLARLAPPSRYGAGPVVDLQQYMISRLTDELDEMRGCAEHLINTSRSNMSVQSRTHDAVLATLASYDMEGLSRVVAEDYPTMLDVDVCTIGFEPSEEGQSVILPGVLALPPDIVEHVLGEAEVMLRAQTPGDRLLFGDAAGLVNSFAVVRLEPAGAPPGLLALGARHDHAFHASQGTELLAFLAGVVEDCVSRWWPAD